jgi:predicted enzyme related to lactoylglutathione lyase
MSRHTSHPAGQPIWFDLMTTDAEAARRFYGAVLGWAFDVSGPEYDGYTMCRVGDAVVAGIGEIQPPGAYPPSWTVYFGTDDADATADAVARHGGAVLAPPMNVYTVGRMAVCQDATGAVFSLWQPVDHRGAELLDEPGAVAWCEVNTRDAERAVAFYEGVFGLRGERLDMDATTYYMLHHHDVPVAGVLQMTADWGDLPPHWMTYIRVDDVVSAKERVLAHGGQVPHGPFDSPYGPIIVVMDPQGAVLSLIGPAPSA